MTILQGALMETNETGQSNQYRIKVREALDAAVTEWFGGLTITPLEDGATLLTGPFPDQPALRGFLTQLWNLNFTVVSVEKIGNESHLGPGI
jgi:hypothetical protein